MICRYCEAPLTFEHGSWRDDTEDPGDGFGGDATCGGRYPDALRSVTKSEPHEPRTLHQIVL